MKRYAARFVFPVLLITMATCHAESDCEERYNQIWYISVDEMISNPGSNHRRIRAVLQDCAQVAPSFNLHGIHDKPSEGNIMQFAVMLDDTGLLNEYFAQGVPVLGVSNTDGEFTTLHTAAMYGANAAAKWLLAKNLDPNIRGLEGLTPLMVASFRTPEHEAVAKLLVEYGADPSIKDDDEYDAKSYAESADDKAFLAWLDSLSQ